MDFLNVLDPNMLDAGVAFLAVAGKYGGIFGILAFCVRMVTRAFSGKERFL